MRGSRQEVHRCQQRICGSLPRPFTYRADQSDIFEWLDSQPDHSLAAIFCAQVVEHLPPARVPELVNLCAAKLERNGPIAMETPNPACLAIFATHFYLDPTHTRAPYRIELLAFYSAGSGDGWNRSGRALPRRG